MARANTRKTLKPLVGVVMGSDSDLPVMRRCMETLEAFGIAYEVRVISAHRTPDAAHEYASTAAGRGLKVIIAAAGMSAALSGILAAKTTLPVIGVPMAAGPLAGIDAALSTMQMPPGVPVGCMAIGMPGRPIPPCSPRRSSQFPTGTWRGSSRGSRPIRHGMSPGRTRPFRAAAREGAGTFPPAAPAAERRGGQGHPYSWMISVSSGSSCSPPLRELGLMTQVLVL